MSDPGTAEGIARRFHEAYEDLAPSHGYETREASRKPWTDVPDQNKNLMIAVVARLLDEGVVRPGDDTPKEAHND
jgi:hypothetical protein